MGREGVTFSGLLNAIDGVAAQEGKVVFMTTNYKDRLDEALVRPGRVDKRIFFGLASKRRARQLFLRFYDDDGYGGSGQGDLEEFASAFSSQLLESQHSMAAIQGHLMKYRHAPDQAVKNIGELQAAEKN